MSQFQAPKGGAIVNNQYFDGGSFIPRVMGKIRDVLKRRRAAKAKLSRAAELFPTATARPYDSPALSDRQIRNIERAHGVKLQRKVTADGRVMANTEHIAQFLDGVMDRKLKHNEVTAKLRSPDVDDHEKMVHLVNHMTDEAGHARRKAGNSMNWYSGDIDKLDKAIGDTYGWHKDDPRVTLAKAVVALTSKDQQPVANVQTAIRILDDAHAQSPTHPFHHLRPYNYAGYEKWLGQVREFVPPGVDIEHVGDATNAYQWYKNWGSIGERGYMTAPTVVDRKTDEPVGRRSGASLIPFAGHTRDQMYEGIKSKKYKVVQYTPAVGEDGRLKPKAWGPASSIAGHLGILKNLVAQLGESGAAKFLVDSHDIGELKRYKTTVDRGDTEKGEPLSGAYLFGPKFGPFFENMNKQHDKLTADKWWSRSWNRALGTLYDAANGEQTTPRSANERKLMRRAAAETAARLNMSVAELQAVLWYYEQHLWRQFGATNDSQSFADAAEHLQRTRGSGSTGEQANRPRPDAVPF